MKGGNIGLKIKFHSAGLRKHWDNWFSNSIKKTAARIDSRFLIIDLEELTSGIQAVKFRFEFFVYVRSGILFGQVNGITQSTQTLL